MAEVLLGAFLQVLFDRLASRELLNYARREELRSRLKRWERNLQDINVVLEDAEERAMGGESRVITSWLDDLRDLAYDVDDLLDEFATEEALRGSFMPSDQAGASSSKLCNLLLPRCITPNFSPRRLVFKHKMGSKIKEIDGRLADIKRRKETLRLSEGGGGRIYVASHQRRLPSTSLAEPFILGRDTDREAIMNFLMDENEDLSVIPIVGMGGLGKTTLAQSVYNDEKVKGSFPVRAWACVSDEFDVLGVTRTILLQIMGGAHEGKDLNVLQVEIQKSLSVSGKKFLIVLDDVWDKEDAALHDRWTLLRRPFESGGAKGSKIIVTTRNQTVASTMKSRTGPAYTLGMLSRDDCEALLAYHALGAVNFDNHPDLKPAGKKIAAKCAGLPLAAKTVGGALRSRYELSEWKAIAESKIWDLPETNGVPQALKLSYFYLPSYLKRCFVYCAVFPKDYEFDRDGLITLWMAEGLLGRPRSEEGMRDLGLRCFRELLSRSFFQPSRGQESSFVMHDLLGDLAASIGGEFCLSLGEGRLDSCKGKKSLEKVRHLSLNPHHYEVSGRFEGFHCLRGLRTLLALNSSKYLHNYVADKVIDDVLRHQKILRVLFLYGYQIREVPNCIGSLRHLRYLNLTKSGIQCLPSSMSTLYNLETLILKDCELLVELPSWINQLINLRCLDISGTPSLRKMPRGIGNLVKLEILPKIIIGVDNGLSLKELKDLQFLREDLTIEGLCNVGEVGDAAEAALNAKTGLTSLILRWRQDAGSASARDAESQMQILGCLQPHANIKNLEIDGYGDTKLPSWIGGPSFVRLERLRLCNCRKTEMLPWLGVLPQLKEVEVRRMDAICAVGPEFYGNMVEPFPSLEKLVFVEMYAWEQWSFSSGNDQGNGPFPRLRKLKLRDCPKLMIIKGWPSQFPMLVEILIDGCPLLETPVATVTLPSLKQGEFRDCDGRMLRGVVSISSSITRLTMFNITRISELSSFSRGGSLNSLTSLQELWIEWCDELTCLWGEKDGGAAGIDGNHALKRLKIRGCHGLVNIGALPPNLEDLHLEDCLNLEELPNDMPSSLRVVRIQECWKVRSLRLPVEGMMTCSLDCDDGLSRSSGRGGNSSVTGPPSQLQESSISMCPALMPFDFLDDNVKQPVVPSLKKLGIEGSEVVGSSLEGTKTVGLEAICITGCKMLKSLTPHLHRSFTCLTQLYLEDCIALELDCFPRLPDSLYRLHIESCPGIKSLPQQMHVHLSLRELVISGCSGIVSFPEEGLPPNLEELEVRDCENLKQLMSKWGLQHATALRSLRIGGKIGCLAGTNSFPPPPDHEEEDEGQGQGKMIKSLTPQLHRSFTRLTKLYVVDCPALELECFPPLPDSLRRLLLHDCPGIKSLPQRMHAHLSLRELHIWSCQGIASFPEEGLPPNLEELEVVDCENLKQPMSKWGLQRTTALRSLRIGGKIGCLVGTNSFPPSPDHEEEDEGQGQGERKGGWHMLPPGLVSLTVENQENLVTISSGMQSHLTSLQILSICGSPKLKFLPREGFPASAGRLILKGCSENLVKRCSKEGGGDYFPIIERIPDNLISSYTQTYIPCLHFDHGQGAVGRIPSGSV